MSAKPTFAINLFDADGDVIEKGVFLFFDTTIIKVAESKEDFEAFLNHITQVNKELQES